MCIHKTDNISNGVPHRFPDLAVRKVNATSYIFAKV